ncbi:MAG TPA: hypothetical protein VMT69_05710 [Kineosporiaceae bacterium]|nr:hypothetical protein [Kineosporiaceae bacterium]
MTPFDATGPALPAWPIADRGSPDAADAAGDDVADVDVAAVAAAADVAADDAAADDVVARLAGCGIGAIAVSGSQLVVASGSMGCLRVTDPADPDAGGRVLGAHGSYVPALLARGGALFSGGSDGRILAWRLGADNLSVVVGAHRAGVAAMVATADGDVVSAGHDGYVMSWRKGTPRLLASHRRGVRVAAALASGALVVAGRDGALLCWRSGGGERPVELRQRCREATLAMTPLPSGELVTATGHFGVVRRWRDLSPGGWPDEIGVHGGWVLAVVILDGGRVAAVGGDHVTVWDLRAGREQRIPLDPGMHATKAVALPAGGGLAVLGSCGSFRLVEVADLAA